MALHSKLARAALSPSVKVKLTTTAASSVVFTEELAVSVGALPSALLMLMGPNVTLAARLVASVKVHTMVLLADCCSMLPGVYTSWNCWAVAVAAKVEL